MKQVSMNLLLMKMGKNMWLLIKPLKRKELLERGLLAKTAQ